MTEPAAISSGRREVALVALALAVLAQGVVLYAPQGAGAPPFPQADKVVHVAVFAVPTVLALVARIPVRWVVGLLAAHAVVSEVVQSRLLPGRSGDPWDSLADLGGIALGVLAVALWRWSRARRERW